MKVTIVEGTPAEIAEAFPYLNTGLVVAADLTQAGVKSAALGSELERSHTSVSTEVARRVLNRIPLSKEQRQVVVAVYNAHPGQISATELCDLVGYSRAQFSGLMGAFGRRIANTPGHQNGDWFWEQEWDYEGGTNLYSFDESVREAIRQEKLV